jgi:hypothetical protein
MKRLAVLPLLLLTFCAGGRGSGPTSTALPGRGAITIEVVPNPIVATKVSGNRYDFPFEVIVRETGGRDVIIERVSADVYAFGTIRVADESYDAARIGELGFSTRVPANGTLRYRFSPRREVEDDRLFGGVSAEVKVEGRDDDGAPVSATTRVTVTR